MIHENLVYHSSQHLPDVEKNDEDASKPVARHFNLPNHFKEHMSRQPQKHRARIHFSNRHP